MDSFKTHSAGLFYEVFSPEETKRIWDRFEFIYTPKHGSWLNMAEIELNVLNAQCLNRHLSSIDKVKSEVPGKKIGTIRIKKSIGSLLQKMPG